MIGYEVRGFVAILTIDNPPVNALSMEVCLALDEAVARSAADPSVRATVIVSALPIEPSEVVEQRRHQGAMARVFRRQARGIEIEQIACLRCGLGP